MKKNDWLILVATAAYSFLFYSQTAGLNFLLFTLLLVGFIAYNTSRHALTKPGWQLAAAASVFTAVSVVVVNSGLSVFANVVSLILLAGFSKLPEASIFTAGLNSVYSLLTSFLKYLARKDDFAQENPYRVLQFAGANRQKITGIGIATGVTLVFVVVYSLASPAFGYLVGQLNFSFISWGWVVFTVVGLWMVFGFFRQQLLPELTLKDMASGNFLQRVKLPVSGKKMGLKYEYRTGFYTLIFLNILLLIFNLTDAFYLLAGHLPAGIVYSEFLHQGVNTLIFSILMAIGVLLYFFRGNINFFSQNKTLKTLAYLWLAQNMVLVLLTFTKTNIYVAEFGLTYKRIGVYVYLTLTAFGLLTSYFKIAEIRNNWFLFRKNAWAVYAVFIFIALFNWDRIITRNNLYNSRQPDLHYLTNLSDGSLPLLIQYMQETNRHYLLQNHDYILFRLKNTRENIENKDWQSWNYNDYRLLNETKNLPEPQFIQKPYGSL